MQVSHYFFLSKKSEDEETSYTKYKKYSKSIIKKKSNNKYTNYNRVTLEEEQLALPELILDSIGFQF